LDAISFGSEGLRCKLRGDPRFGKGGVLGDESDFIYANAAHGVFPEIEFEPVTQRAGLRVTFHESANEIREFISLYTRLKGDACDASAVEQIGEAPFSLGRFQRHPVEQQLRTGRSKQEPSTA